MTDTFSVDSDVEVSSTDTLGGNALPKTGLYKMVIDVAYTGKSTGGATHVTINFKSADPAVNAYHTEVLWVKSKKGLSYYMGGKNKDKKIILPSMQTFQQILAICDLDPNNVKVENKTISLWDKEKKAMAPTEVPVLTELKGKILYAGLRTVRENKNKQDAEGNWVPSNDERLYNELHRVFYPDGFSVEEKKLGAKEPAFVKTWKDKNTPDFVVDKFKAVKEVSSSAPSHEDAIALADSLDDDLFDD